MQTDSNDIYFVPWGPFFPFDFQLHNNID